MKTALACVLACTFSLNAQITAVLTKFPTGSSEVRIRNNSAVSLTAFAVSMSPVAQSGAKGAPLTVYVDVTVDNTTMPLLRDQEFAVPVTGRFRPGHPVEDLFEPPIVTAGIFADGTTKGDPALLTRLVMRRCNMLQAVETAIEMLSDAGRRNVPRRQLVNQFTTMADSLNHWYLPPEQTVARTLYQSIVGKLINLPELPLGAPFPPTTFVQQEMALLNRQRVTLMESQPSLADAALIRR